MNRTKITVIITATVLVVASLYIGSNVLTPVEAGVRNGDNGGDFFSLLTACEPDNVQHWDKIIFKNKKDLFKRADGGTLAIEKGSIMDIKVLDDPAKIEFPLQKAVDRSNIPWKTEDGDITLKDLKLIDVEYAIVCVETGRDNGPIDEALELFCECDPFVPVSPICILDCERDKEIVCLDICAEVGSVVVDAFCQPDACDLR